MNKVSENVHFVIVSSDYISPQNHEKRYLKMTFWRVVTKYRTHQTLIVIKNRITMCQLNSVRFSCTTVYFTAVTFYLHDSQRKRCVFPPFQRHTCGNKTTVMRTMGFLWLYSKENSEKFVELLWKLHYSTNNLDDCELVFFFVFCGEMCDKALVHVHQRRSDLQLLLHNVIS